MQRYRSVMRPATLLDGDGVGELVGDSDHAPETAAEELDQSKCDRVEKDEVQVKGRADVVRLLGDAVVEDMCCEAKSGQIKGVICEPRRSWSYIHEPRSIRWRVVATAISRCDPGWTMHCEERLDSLETHRRDRHPSLDTDPTGCANHAWSPT
jgi:hypothetical protein